MSDKSPPSSLTPIELEFAQIRYHWKIFCELFDNEKNVQLLNKSGSEVFRLFQRLLINDTMQSLCRIADPAQSYGNSNNSLRHHFDIIRKTLDSSSQDEIRNHLTALDLQLESIKKMRNKVLSHNDLAVVQKSADYPEVSYDDIEKTIDLICQILHKLFKTNGQYMPTSAVGGTSILLNVLSRGHDIS